MVEGLESDSTILVADDEPINRALIQRRLERAGYRVITAQNGREAVEKARAERPDLVILDVMMPVMDGLAFIQAVRARREYDGLRIMMVTTEAEQAQVLRALEVGANEYLMKPFTREVIVDKLRMLAAAA